MLRFLSFVLLICLQAHTIRRIFRNHVHELHCHYQVMSLKDAGAEGMSILRIIFGRCTRFFYLFFYLFFTDFLYMLLMNLLHKWYKIQNIFTYLIIQKTATKTWVGVNMIVLIILLFGEPYVPCPWCCARYLW